MTREEAMGILDKMPLCNECDSSNFPYTCVECGDAFLMAIEALKQPEIVRCKDCKHFDGIDCKVNDIVNIMNTDWFCADGERRTDDA